MGTRKNDTDAVRWYTRAARKGNADAQLSLGSAYAMGSGVERDGIQAHMWVNLSVASGHPQASELLEIIEGKLSEGQIEAAVRMKEEWTQAQTETGGA